MTDTGTADAGEETASVVFGEGSARGVAVGIGKVLGLAMREYRVVFRARWVAGLAALFAVFSVGVVTFGSSAVGSARYGAVVASLGELSVYLVPLAALALGYGTVVGAVERGTLPMLFSLPVSRFRVLVGMYLGRLLGLWSALVVGLGAGGAALVGVVGVDGWGIYLSYLVGSLLAGAAFLAVGVFVSALAGEKAHALGGALLVWVWFVLVHDLIALGALVTLDLRGIALSGFVLANPADLLRTLVFSSVPETAGGLGATFATGLLSPPVALVALLAWAVVPVLAARPVIRRRRV